MNASAMSRPAKPWYRQFWPWFLIALPGMSVALGVTTLVVAIRGADSLVRDDWYDAGVSINRDFEREARASVLGVAATITVDGGRLSLVLHGDAAAETTGLRLDLAHPADASRDRSIMLVRDPGSGKAARFVPSETIAAPPGSWDAALTPADGTWRIAGRVRLGAGEDAHLAAEP